MSILDPELAAGSATILDPSDAFLPRHLGPDARDVQEMLATLGLDSLEALAQQTVPAAIRSARPLALPAPATEAQALAELRALADRNRVLRSCLGMGYHGTITPPVILRNILENPCWYTQYTPYQAEIAQGRLEALLNFQTMVADLTGLPLANASLLDEGTAAAEAMIMCRSIVGGERRRFLVATDCHPQTIAVVQGRAEALGIEVVVADPFAAEVAMEDCFGVLVQYPGTDGAVRDQSPVVDRAHAAGAMVVVAADILALTLLKSPGEMGADVAVGSTQRFGVPMGFGGPHAAYIATREEHARKLPGRLVGVSRDAAGRPALRLAIQTREQHIKRDRATSNICTAQVLLAIIAGMYAAWHGPHGLRRIAERCRAATAALAAGLRRHGFDVGAGVFFDTIRVRLPRAEGDAVVARAAELGYELRRFENGDVGISFDETTTRADVAAVLAAFAPDAGDVDLDALLAGDGAALPEALVRRSGYLTHEVFNTYHAETEMLRYITQLQSRDLSLAHSMIPLGSCTMKLNATSEMIGVTWEAFGGMHPFAPPERSEGYRRLFLDLERWLGEITGFAGISLQPNAGSQGEYTGLLVIRAWHRSRGDHQRDVCLIPVSAHGTNPASAVMAGFRVVPVGCDAHGNIDLADLEAKAREHAPHLGALMVTYPSTHGVFEETIRRVCAIVHEHGGQVYLDGANMNALVGVCRPGELGADVCHLNLHKTFCIPHGGGGPGMGPIGVAAHLVPFLPGHPVQPPAGTGGQAILPVSAAPYGSPSILVIPWMYVRMMGAAGLRRATLVAILSANYMAERLRGHYGIVYTGPNGRCAHEFIVDLRPFDRTAGIKPDDVAKRLMDYGFHAPTMSWPVAGTLMIEPTESEPKAELDRFCDALIAIRAEIAEIEAGAADREHNLLKHAPHPIETLVGDAWDRPYPRERAAYPLPWLRQRKFWPPVGRVDNPYGDRHLACTCPPMSAFGGGAG